MEAKRDVALFIIPIRIASLSQLFLMDTEQQKKSHTNHHNFTEGVKESLPLCIIAGESYETSKGDREGEEDLGGSVQPHLRVLQYLPLQRM